MVEQFLQQLAGVVGLWPAVVIFLAVGIAGLKYGADWLVDGATNVGFRFGISAIMIGLTIVAFGTSAPELVVSLMTAVQGKPEICLGNVIGSNVANTTLILGISAMIVPLKIAPDSVKFDVPTSFAAILLVFFLALIGSSISRLDGLILLAVFTTWMLWLIRKTLRENRARRQNRVAAEGKPAQEEEEVVFHQRPILIDLALICVGLLVLVLGADSLIAGAVTTAKALSVPDIVVGLTVVAAGTSLPELAVCVVAALRNHADLTIGNVMGSNVFNALLILGCATLIAPIGFLVPAFDWTGDPGTLYIDIPFCVLVCGLVWPMMRHRHSLGRKRGSLLLLLYVGYLITLVLRNT